MWNSGGIVVIWDSSRVEVVNKHISNVTMSLRCKSVGTVKEWVFKSVYRPVDHNVKECFW